VDRFPYDINKAEIKPNWTHFKGWKSDLTSLTRYEDAPEALKDYVRYLEKVLEIPITMVSVGPDRAQTLLK